jgi:iron-sulfur cluster repair protein YtfE (RIC family)
MKESNMSEQKAISAVFEQDHDRLDRLFKTFQECKRSNCSLALRSFMEFRSGLQRHIVWEEDVLFPLWEEKTGIKDGGPTTVMRAEHRQIVERLEAIHRKVHVHDPDSDQDEKALLALLGSHNMKEERILYPSIDQVTTQEERDTVFQGMERIPEERYRVGCGAEAK